MRWLALLLFMASPAYALECYDQVHKEEVFTVCKVDASADIQLFLDNPDSGSPLGSFKNIDRLLEKDGAKLAFAMNAGMYHDDRSPVGLYVQDGEESAPLISIDGPGNFGLLPNGVFCIGDGWARVYETLAFADKNPSCRYATQSGPMLVIDGALHPRFLPQSDSVYVRNGVGTSADGRTIWFAISEDEVNFHTFATLFRDVLGTPQALYFDGNISRLYMPALGRHDGGFPMGPMVGVVIPSGD